MDTKCLLMPSGYNENWHFFIQIKHKSVNLVHVFSIGNKRHFQRPLMRPLCLVEVQKGDCAE